ncbi:MAG: hypothetical protein VR65_11595 [Desulfobulbaceae bacterium BRH_c16a]|nr:MAG: hypothetical protein VR65_11595 [Desulfobulbaceae bacterium BRH_c16a]
MGKKKTKQLVYLTALLVLTSFLVYRPTELVRVVKPMSLQVVLGPVDGFKLLATTPLDDATVSFLELDDYTQSRYARDRDNVDLYIGYYNGLDKVSAAHSPLVCFPGQGWAVDQPTEHYIEVGQEAVNYAEMVASLGDRKELVLYWYQADNKTVAKVYKNKINAVINKLMGQSEEQAFVRITVPIVPADGQGVEQARNVGKAFIASFYPVFQSYVQSNPRRVQ